MIIAQGKAAEAAALGGATLAPGYNQVIPTGFHSWLALLAHRRTQISVSDGSQPPMKFDLSLSQSAGSRSLERLETSLSLPMSASQ
jgi:hypothetical protein